MQLLRKLNSYQVLTALPGTKETLTKCQQLFFSHGLPYLCPPLHLQCFCLSSVPSHFMSFYNPLLSSVLPSYIHIPTPPHSPPSIPPPGWNHNDHISLIHSLRKYVMRVYYKPRTCNCLHGQCLCQLDMVSQALRLVHVFTPAFYIPWTTVSAQQCLLHDILMNG